MPENPWLGYYITCRQRTKRNTTARRGQRKEDLIEKLLDEQSSLTVHP